MVDRLVRDIVAAVSYLDHTFHALEQAMGRTQPEPPPENPESRVWEPIRARLRRRVVNRPISVASSPLEAALSRPQLAALASSAAALEPRLPPAHRAVFRAHAGLQVTGRAPLQPSPWLRFEYDSYDYQTRFVLNLAYGYSF